MPIGWDEFKAIYALSKKGIKVNCTCIFTEEQCVLAANAGASYVSIFHCRLKDIGGDPVKVIAGTRQIFDQPAMMRRLSSGASACRRKFSRRTWQVAISHGWREDH